MNRPLDRPTRRSRPALPAACGLALAGAVLAAPALAGPADFDTIPAEARFVVHVDVEALLETPHLGPLLREVVKGESDFDVDMDLDDEGPFAAFGVDPLETVLDVTVMMIDPDDDEGVIRMRTTDAIDRMVDELEAAGEMHLRETDFGWSVGGAEGDGIVALRRERDGTRTIILGDSMDLVRGAARSRGGFDGLRPGEPALVFVSVRELDALMDDDVPPALRSASAFGAALRSDDGGLRIDAALVTGDADTARALIDVANGGLALLRLAEPDFAEMADLLRLAVDGDRMTATIRIPEELLADAIDGDVEMLERRLPGLRREEHRAAEAAARIATLEVTKAQLEVQRSQLKDAGVGAEAVRALDDAIAELEDEIEDLQNSLRRHRRHHGDDRDLT